MSRFPLPPRRAAKPGIHRETTDRVLAYLGPDERHWRRFQGDVFDDPTTRFVALAPTVLRARDLSY